MADILAEIGDAYFDAGEMAEGRRYFARPAGLHMANLPDYTVNDLAARRDRLRSAIASGFLTRRDTKVPITADLLGATVEASIGSVSAPDNGHEAPLSSFYGNQHNIGHMFLAYITDPVNQSQLGVMSDTATAIRDPVFYRWHKHIDDFSFRWQERQTSNDFSDAPPVLIRKNLPGGTLENQSPDIILAFKDDGKSPIIPGSSESDFDGQAYGEQYFGGENWGGDFSSSAVTTNELHTRMFQRTITWGPNNRNSTTIDYLDQEKEFFYFIRVENQLAEARDVTIRIFLVAQAVAEDRRMWIEMDKFRSTLQPSQRAVIFRPAALSSVIKKPATRPPGSAAMPSITVEQGADAEHESNYCDCGWPYNLLLPRGTHAGMGFRLLVMITDWQRDQIPDDTPCGSMSYCGAKDKYPDSRAMGYPFDRPFSQDSSIAQVIASHGNMATRDISIRWLE